jgi:hypothetical protein
MSRSRSDAVEDSNGFRHFTASTTEPTADLVGPGLSFAERIRTGYRELADEYLVALASDWRRGAS